MAALMATGRSRLSGIHYIRRGYSNLEEKIRGLGGDISRFEGNPQQGQPVVPDPASRSLSEDEGAASLPTGPLAEIFLRPAGGFVNRAVSTMNSTPRPNPPTALV